MSRLFKILLLIFSAFINVELLSAQTDIRVQGVVVSADTGKPISNIVITNDLVTKGSSDADGRFSFVVDRDAKLLFKYYKGMDYEPQEVDVEGRREITVYMNSFVKRIEAVVISATVKKKFITIDKTEITVKGNYIHISPKLHIPHKLMTPDYRYVVQPVLVDITSGSQRYFRPMAMDGERYDIIENRHLNFGKTPDILEPYIVPNTIRQGNDIYSYSDSLYVKNKDLGNDFKVDCYFVLTSYNKPRRSDKDSIRMFEIARGTVNPLRFFDYSVDPMQLDGSLLAKDERPYITPTIGADTIYVPTPELEPRASRGVSKIEFGIGQTVIDRDIAQNQQNIKDIQNILRDIQFNPDATLDSISMVGYASPDGTYETNIELAELRTKEILNVVTRSIDPYNLSRIKLSSHGAVEPWSSVTQLAKEDNPALADKISEIIKKTSDSPAKTQAALQRLPEYRKLIAAKYLPQLRRVTYTIDYSLLRPMSYAEIADKYNRYGSDSLSRYELYKLVEGTREPMQREVIIDQAIEKYPNFSILANYKAVEMIRMDSVNLDILAPLFDGQYTPFAARYNQVVMSLTDRRFADADSLIQDLPITDRTLHLHKIASLLNGDFDDAYDYFAQFGGLNEVLILLAMNKDKEAHEKISALMKMPGNSDNAKYHYISALCANRIVDLTMAIMHLNIALQIDPSLTEIAKIDADLVDIYDLIIIQNMGGLSNEN